MRKPVGALIITVVLGAIPAAFLLTASGRETAQGMVVLTEIPAGELADDHGSDPGGDPARGAAGRFPEEARIALLDPRAPGTAPRILTGEFRSACAPRVSADGTHLLFAAKKKAADPWRIWEAAADGSGSRLVTPGLGGCTDPAYLPGGRIVFSAPVPPDAAPGLGTRARALYTCALDGSGLERIVFDPGESLAPAVLPDGRILFLHRRRSAAGATKLRTVRPDGTGLALFYAAPAGAGISGPVRLTGNGEVVFVERAAGSPADVPVSIRTSRPLRSRRVLAGETGGGFHSIAPRGPGAWVASWRPPGAGAYALYELDPASGSLGRRLCGGPHAHLVEPVYVERRPRPKRLPSLVDRDRTAGWFFCLDANLSGGPGSPGSARRASAVQVWGREGMLGEVALEADGSFFIEVPADVPLRFVTVDDRGTRVRGPSDWIWVRPKERRGCIGCHEDPERAPSNRVPLAVTKGAVTLPGTPPPLASAGTIPGVGGGR